MTTADANIAPYDVLADGVVDANGNVAITWPALAAGETVVGSVTIPNSTPDIAWAAMISTQKKGSWFGSTPGGPFLVDSGMQLVATATNLVPGLTYVAYLTGYQVLAPAAPPGIIPAQTSAVNVVAEDVQGPKGSSAAAGIPLDVDVKVQPSWTSLHIYLFVDPSTGAAGRIDVTGDDTGAAYYGGAAQTPYTSVIIDPLLDRSYTVRMTSPGPAVGVYSITGQLSESTVQVETGPGNSLAISGGIPDPGITDIVTAVTADLLPIPAAGLGYLLEDLWINNTNPVGTTAQVFVAGARLMFVEGGQQDRGHWDFPLELEIGRAVEVFVDAGATSGVVAGCTFGLHN